MSDAEIIECTRHRYGDALAAWVAQMLGSLPRVADGIRTAFEREFECDCYYHFWEREE